MNDKLNHTIVGHIWTNDRAEVTRCQLTLRDRSAPYDPGLTVDAVGPDAIDACAAKIKPRIALSVDAQMEADATFGRVA